MNESIDHMKVMTVKCNWQSNVDGMDIENCIAVNLQQPNDEM